jgi:TolB-like protein
VLPFTNMSGDSEQEYFSDGITEDLITALARFRHLSVLSRHSTFVYKGRSVKVEEVGKELGARFVLEGSVRKGGNKVRVTAQLIDTDNGAHVWAERFDRELADIFAVQDEIVAAISAQLGFSLIDAAVATSRARSPAQLTAYDHLLRGQAAWRRGDAIESRDHYLKAVEADPGFATGLGRLAFIYSEDRFMQLCGISIDEEARLARHYAERAIARDDGDPLLHHSVGTALLNLGDLDKAKHHLELACALNPHNPYSIMNLGMTIAFMGAHREGFAMVERGFGLEPRIAPAMQAVPFFCHYLIGDYESAIADFARIDNPFAYFQLLRAASHAQLGQAGLVQRALAEFEERRPEGFDVAGFARVYCDLCRLPEDRERAREGFCKAGLIA